MAITLDGTTGITTPGLTNTGTETIVNLTTTGNTTLGDATTDTLNVGNGGLIKDASGNVGIGVTPVAFTNSVGLQVGSNTIVQQVVSNQSMISANAYYAGSWKAAATQTGYAAVRLNAVGPGVTSFHGSSASYTAGNALPNMDSSDVKVIIDASGNVGIGQSSITQQFSNYTQLNISGSSGATIQMQTGSTTRANIVSDANALYIAQLAGNMQFAVGGTGTGTERMRIDASGNLLLNTTGQVAQGKFSVSFVGASNQAAAFNESSGASSWTTVLFQRTGTTIGSISNATSSTAYNTSSDYRLKNTITPMTGALAKVAQLKPVTYKWNIDNEDGEGFIAHELAEVCPHAVTGAKDAVDEEGNPVYQGIDTSFLVATLTAAIQEQQALITALTARITALENK